MIETARATSGTSPLVHASCVRGISACGSDPSPAGTGGSAGELRISPAAETLSDPRVPLPQPSLTSPRSSVTINPLYLLNALLGRSTHWLNAPEPSGLIVAMTRSPSRTDTTGDDPFAAGVAVPMSCTRMSFDGLPRRVWSIPSVIDGHADDVTI